MKRFALLMLLLLVPAVGAAQESTCPSVAVTDSSRFRHPVFAVNMLGNVLARPTRSITEDDAILVRVLTIDTLAARLVTLSGNEVKRVALGTFDFNVEPVYVGIASLGPVLTDLQNPTFEIATNSAGETYITRAESGKDRILYALIYTAFIGGKRVANPPPTPPRSLLSRVNPMFGIILNDISRNALGGVSVDLPFGLVVHGGWHWGRTSEIDPTSGLAVGSAFSKDGIIPVVRKWNRDDFVGLTLDARVALGLLGLAGKATIP